MNAMKTYPILLGWLCAIICGCTTAPLAETPVAETPVKEVPVAETAVEEATPPAVATPALPEQLFQLSQDARCRQVVTTCIVAGQPLRVLLDTGATHTVFHSESAKQLKQITWMDTSHIQFSGNATQRPDIFIAPVLLGPGDFDPRPLLSIDLSGVRSMMAEPIDGIVGMDFLTPLPLTLDFNANEFYWGIPENPAALKLSPLEGNRDPNGRLFISVKSGEKTFPLLLDTGSSVTRVYETDWAPGRGKEISAQISDVNAAAHIKAFEGNRGALQLNPVVETRAFTPLMANAGEPSMLGVDALRGLILIHLPSGDGSFGQFLIAKPTPAP